MESYNILVNKRTLNKISQFYKNVAKKYSNIYSIENMLKDIESAKDSIYKIENGLLRREPIISIWKGLLMANDKQWYFAYKINGNTITVVDACHSQNMHESKERNIIRMTEEQLKKYIFEKVINRLKEMIL